MFVAVSTRTMASAKLDEIEEPERWVSIEEIRQRKREEAAAERRKQALAELETKEGKERERRRRDAIDKIERAVEAWRNRPVEEKSLRRLSSEIIREVCEAEGVAVSTIMSQTRNYKISAIRHKAIRAVADERPDLSLPQIGRIFADRDHTTILHSLRKTWTEGKPR